MPDFKLDDLTPRMTGKGINGVSFPAFIRNGGSFFLSELGVYEDGIVECWGGVNLALFRHKVATGWVQTFVAEGEELNAYNLARLTPVDAAWHLTPQDLIERVEMIVSALNPSPHVLNHSQGFGPDQFAEGDWRLTDATWLPDDSETTLSNAMMGVSRWAFWRVDDVVHVVTVSLFDDDIVRINGLGAPEFMTLDELCQSDCLSVAMNGDKIVIQNLCTFTAANVNFTIPPKDFIAELEVNRDKRAGRTTPLDRTIEAFQAYCDNPTKRTLETLRQAYESVPKHMRRSCGDMDTKDIPIRIALYGKQEIEKWPHFRVAKLREEPLPSITVPEPDDT